MPLHPYLGLPGRAVNRLARTIRCALFDHAVALSYHRVIDLEMDSQSLAVSPSNFYDHLVHLKQNHPLLTPAELKAHALAGTIPKKAVVLTFDDGYADNVLNMLPIVETLQVPVTVFVSTDLLGSGREFWWDELERIFLAAESLPKILEFPEMGACTRFPTETHADRLKAYQKFHSRIKELGQNKRDALLGKLREWAGLGEEGRETHRSMTHDELARLAKSPYVTLGAHSRSHAVLGLLEPEEQRAEMADSKAILEALTGLEIGFFAYPFGTRSEYTPETARLCREVGFQGAYANFYGQIFKGTDLYQEPRMLVRNWSRTEFQKNLSRFFRG